MVSLFEFIFADSNSCSKESGETTISFTNKEGYMKPYPIILNTTLNIKEFVSIDENENSISIRLNLISRWKDSGLNCSHKIDT